MKVKVYHNVISIERWMVFKTEKEFTRTFQYLSNVISSHKTNLLCDDDVDILYKDKVKDEWHCTGIIHFLQKGMMIMISEGVYVKQDLDCILSFKKKMIEIELSIPNIKDYLSPIQSFSYPNTKNKRISVVIELW